MAVLPYPRGTPLLLARSRQTHMDDPIPELKRRLARVVIERIEGWNQGDAAYWLGTDRPRVSDLRAGRLGRFSLEQLIRFASRVYGRVEIRVEWQRRHSFLFSPPRKP
jgi:predicted XRE-type DNA-binding protein